MSSAEDEGSEFMYLLVMDRNYPIRGKTPWEAVRAFLGVDDVTVGPAGAQGVMSVWRGTGDGRCLVGQILGIGVRRGS